jgi:hypothetical protein
MLLPVIQSVKGAGYPLLQVKTQRHESGQAASASRSSFNVTLQRSL